MSNTPETRMPILTEATLLAALRKRHTAHGNGGAGRYAFLTHVRTGAGWDQQEIDAVAVALWPSEHYDIHAFEVKCSRTDWLREICPNTYKSKRARQLCDTFSIVAPKRLVRAEELPSGWGLLEASTHDDGTAALRMASAPERLHDAAATRGEERLLGRGFLVSLLRAADVVPGMTTGLRRDASKEIA